MPDRRFDDALLERLASRTAYPATPQLRAGVMMALRADAGRQAVAAPVGRRAEARPAYATWRALAAFSVLGAVIALLAALAVPSSREAIADFFGIDGSSIEQLPAPPPGITATPLPTPARIEDIGRRTTLADAQRLVGFEFALPDGERPREVYTVLYAGEYSAVLRYDDFDLWEARPRDIVFGKGLPRGVTWLEVVIRGRQGAWIEGGPHVLTLTDDTGEPIPGSSRVVERNTLVWNSGYALYRIETSQPQGDALRIAESLR